MKLHQVTTSLIRVGSRFDTAAAIVCSRSSSKGKAIGSELRTTPSRGTGRGLPQVKATEAKFLDFLKKSPQFVIPIYQRTYYMDRERVPPAME